MLNSKIANDKPRDRRNKVWLLRRDIDSLCNVPLEISNEEVNSWDDIKVLGRTSAAEKNKDTQVLSGKNLNDDVDDDIGNDDHPTDESLVDTIVMDFIFSTVVRTSKSASLFRACVTRQMATPSCLLHFVL